MRKGAIDNYKRVGHMLSLMKSKARRSLKAGQGKEKRPRAHQARMDRELEELVWRRAGRRCGYCQVHQADLDLPFEVDHIIAEHHEGRTLASNLCNDPVMGQARQ